MENEVDLTCEKKIQKRNRYLNIQAYSTQIPFKEGEEFKECDVEFDIFKNAKTKINFENFCNMKEGKA